MAFHVALYRERQKMSLLLWIYRSQLARVVYSARHPGLARPIRWIASSLISTLNLPLARGLA